MDNKPAIPAFPIDPLDGVIATTGYKRSVITGILDSYNGNYDFLVESIQNAVDALEDAKLMGLPGPYCLEVTINLKENSLSVLDTGVGMARDTVISVLTPHISYKTDAAITQKRGAKHSYRGYKGVGLTFLAYGTDDIRLHSARDGVLTKVRMQYGHKWALSKMDEPSRIDVDKGSSPLDGKSRGTFVKVQFSTTTKPKSLAHLAATLEAWSVIVRTRTAAGQVLLHRDALCPIVTKVIVVSGDGDVKSTEVKTTFLYPHEVEHKPPLRFLDVEGYMADHPGQVEIPAEHRRQDGIYLVWDTAKITEELTVNERAEYAEELVLYSPLLYAFVPYQGSVWSDINNYLAGAKKREHLRPGLMIALNRQRLADLFELVVTRYETFGRNVLVIVHFDNAKPDHGRKTVQEEVIGLATAAANRAVQYLGSRRPFLRPAGEAPTPEQRQVEKDHQDWEFNVRAHSQTSPLRIPPIAYISTPLTEQDVVGLFHQFCALGAFPGISIYATSQIHTYDCLVDFSASIDDPRIRYRAIDDNPLGLSSFVIGARGKYETGRLTLEFKNNLDGLISDLADTESRKSFQRIDICVCWSSISERFKGYEITEITQKSLDQRAFPGVTHLLTRDGDAHKIQVIMLKSVVQMIQAGQLTLEANLHK